MKQGALTSDKANTSAQPRRMRSKGQKYHTVATEASGDATGSVFSSCAQGCGAVRKIGPPPKGRDYGKHPRFWRILIASVPAVSAGMVELFERRHIPLDRATTWLRERHGPVLFARSQSQSQGSCVDEVALLCDGSAAEFSQSRERDVTW